MPSWAVISSRHGGRTPDAGRGAPAPGPPAPAPCAPVGATDSSSRGRTCRLLLLRAPPTSPAARPVTSSVTRRKNAWIGDGSAALVVALLVSGGAAPCLLLARTGAHPVTR